MTTVFLFCAAIGGAILLIQIALMLIGIGAEAADFDVPGDVDVDVDVDVDFDVDVDAADGLADVDHPGSVEAFRVLSFRTIIAALTFFGLGGLTATSAGYSRPFVLAAAVIAGAAAMFVVYWLFRGVRKLQAEGTVRIHRSVGKPATVYIPIPGNKSGTGKIQLSLQNRTMEYLALTSGSRLPTGAKVVVTSVITSDTVEVEPVPESERSEHV